MAILATSRFPRCIKMALVAKLSIIAFQFAVHFILLGGVSHAAEDQLPEVRRKLVNLWDENREAYSKCHLRCKVIRRRPEGKVDKKEAEDLVAKLPKNYLNEAGQDAVHDLAQIFKLGIDKDKSVWGELELWIDGDRARQEERYEGEGDALIHTGSEEAHLDGGNDQLDLYQRGGCRRALHSPSDFAPLPQVSTLALIEIYGNPELPTIETRIRGTTYHVDRSSGFIHKLVEDKRRAVHEIIAVDGATISGKVPFPRTTVDLTFHNDLLVDVQIAVFDEVELNKPIPEEKFKIGIDSPTKVFDHRKNNARKPEYVGTIEPTPDVIAALNKIESKKK